MKLLSRLVTWIVVLCVLFTLAWFGAAWAVKSNYGKFVDGAAQRGVIVTSDDLSVTGYPLKFMVQVSGAAATRPADSLSWQGPETVSGGINLLRPFTGVAQVSGVHRLVSGGVPMTINVQAQTLEASINPLDRTLRSLDVVVPTVEVTSPGVGALKLTEMIASLSPLEDSQVPFRLSVEQIALPQPFASLANPLDIDVRGHVFPQLPAGVDRQSIGKWQRENGLITLTRVTGATEELGWNGEGQLSISPELQPNANLTMRIKGMEPFMEKLVQLGVIDQGRVGWAKVGLALFTRPALDGQGTEVVAPLVIRNGNVVLGPIELAKLPPISWPQ